MKSKFYLLVVALFSIGASANDYVGIPIGSAIDFDPGDAENSPSAQILVDGPFDGLFAIFDRYRAHVSVDSGLLFLAEAEKTYSSFETCSGDTTRLWNSLKQRFGRPVQDNNQNWWFDIGNRQKISVDCTIYGKSGKIAMNVRVVDSGLAREAMKALD